MSALFATFGIDWHLLIAQGINFLVLVVVLTWLLYKPVIKMVRERERVIAKGVQDAEEAATKLAAADVEAGGRVSAADAEALLIVESARRAASEEKAKTLAEAESRGAQMERDAALRANEDAARIKRDSEKEIARLAVLAAERVIAAK